jgi:site-specific recombinase XerD
MDLLFAGTPTLRRLQEGLFSPHLAHLDDLASVRLQQGYARMTVTHQIQVVARFADWLEAAGLGLHQLTTEIVTDFLKNGLGPWSGRGMASLVRAFVVLLQRAGVTAPVPDVRPTEIECLIDAFEQFLLRERALSKATAKNYTPIVKLFLTETFDTGGAGLSVLAAAGVTAFIRRHARDHSHGRLRADLTALRVFFRYLLVEGKVGTDLSGAVPPVAEWRLQSLPKALPPDDVVHLVNSCDFKTPAGRRDYAILLLLSRLGLRAGDVVHLMLDNLDWEAGEIVLCGKGRRIDRLPLPQDVGLAIAEYLQHGRPPGAPTRRVFVSPYAPFNGFRSSVAVCSIMRRGLRRAKLTPARKGAHILRHALATRMLRGGATLTEIGRILRHQYQDTTAIYAKVNLDALRPLALRWPGGAV